MTRYYYTCPIKALYMMKEFGIEFETKHKSKFNGECFFRAFGRLWVDGMDCSDDSVRICSLIHAKDNDITRVNDRIYIIKESEHIFEPEEKDLINYKSRSGKNKITATYLESFIDDDNEAKWKLQSQGMNSPKIYRIDQRPCEIIMRANKQFFMPEVEND